MTFSAEQQREFDRATDAFRAHGYWISAEAIPGLEATFIEDLSAALAKVESAAAFLRGRYGYRGLSKRLLEELHVSLPAPSFNVSSLLSAELANRERRGRA